MVVDLRIMIALSRSTLQIVNSVRQFPAIQMHNTQQMQRIEVTRICRDQLAAAAFRLIVVPRGIIAGRGIHAVRWQWRKAAARSINPELRAQPVATHASCRADATAPDAW